MAEQTFAERRKAQRDALVETIKSKLTIEDIVGLYEFFNVDDDIEITMKDGVQSLVPFGVDGPKIETKDSLEVYALDQYAREFAQRLVRVRFNQLINPAPVEKEDKPVKSKTPV